MDKSKAANRQDEIGGSTFLADTFSPATASTHRRGAFLLCRALMLGLLSEHHPDTLGLDGVPVTDTQRRHVCTLLLNMTNPSIFHLGGAHSIVDAALDLYIKRVGV